MTDDTWIRKLELYTQPKDVDMELNDEAFYTPAVLASIQSTMDAIRSAINSIEYNQSVYGTVKITASNLNRILNYITMYEASHTGRIDKLTFTLKYYVQIVTIFLENVITSMTLIKGGYIDLTAYEYLVNLALKTNTMMSMEEITKALDAANFLGKKPSSSDTTNVDDIKSTKVTELNSFDRIIGFDDEKLLLRGYIRALDGPPSIIQQSLSNKSEVDALLLYGPPGTGKTALAAAFAYESKRSFYVLTASNLISSYIGESEEKLRNIFKRAATSPSVVFIDEIEALFMSRTADSPFSLPTLQTELYQLLSGVESSAYTNIYFIAATNLKQFLDDALMRRFKNVIMIGLPDWDSRAKLYRLYLLETYNIELSSEFDQRAVIAGSAFMSAANIKSQCDAIMRKKQSEVVGSLFFRFGVGNDYFHKPSKLSNFLIPTLDNGAAINGYDGSTYDPNQVYKFEKIPSMAGFIPIRIEDFEFNDMRSLRERYEEFLKGDGITNNDPYIYPIISGSAVSF